MPLTTPPAFTDGTLAALYTDHGRLRHEASKAEAAYKEAVTAAGEPIRRYVRNRIRRGCDGAWWACTSSVRVEIGYTRNGRDDTGHPTVNLSLYGVGNTYVTLYWYGREPLDSWLDRVIAAWKALNA